MRDKPKLAAQHISYRCIQKSRRATGRDRLTLQFFDTLNLRLRKERCADFTGNRGDQHLVFDPDNMRGHGAGPGSNDYRHITGGEQLLWSYPAGINRLQVQPILKPDTFLDGDPEWSVGRGDVGVTDCYRFKPCGAKHLAA